jgi:hypothetical protein
MKLDSEKRARLAKLIRLLGSDNAGEVAAAAHKLQEVLRSSGADLHDLAALLEDEQAATMQGRSDQAGWTHDAPGPPPSSPPRRRARSFLGDGMLRTMTVCLGIVVAVVGAGLMMRSSGERLSEPVDTASAPSHAPAPSKPVATAQSSVAVKQAALPSPVIEAKKDPPPAQVRQDPPPTPPLEANRNPPSPKLELKQDSPAQSVEIMREPPKLSSTPPRTRPIFARSEPTTTADQSEARNAARSAVGEIIRQIRFPQRVDRAITMVSVSAYGSQIVASYRAAIPTNSFDGDELKRLAVETACGLPEMVSALNRGATHKARYTDPEGGVSEVVVAAQDCGY